jgi:hypothetical protein
LQYPGRLEVVLVGCEQTKAEYDGFVASMPWLVIPFETADFHRRCNILRTKYLIKGFPALVILDASAESAGRGCFLSTITTKGVDLLTSDPEALCPPPKPNSQSDAECPPPAALCPTLYTDGDLPHTVSVCPSEGEHSHFFPLRKSHEEIPSKTGISTRHPASTPSAVNTAHGVQGQSGVPLCINSTCTSSISAIKRGAKEYVPTKHQRFPKSPPPLASWDAPGGPKEKLLAATLTTEGGMRRAQGRIALLDKRVVGLFFAGETYGCFSPSIWDSVCQTVCVSVHACCFLASRDACMSTYHSNEHAYMNLYVCIYTCRFLVFRSAHIQRHLIRPPSDPDLDR